MRTAVEAPTRPVLVLAGVLALAVGALAFVGRPARQDALLLRGSPCAYERGSVSTATVRAMAERALERAELARLERRLNEVADQLEVQQETSMTVELGKLHDGWQDEPQYLRR